MLFVSRKAYKGRFYVLFAKSKKTQKDGFLLLFASAKSNQKQTKDCGPLDSRDAVQNSERGSYLLSRKLCAYQEIFTKICSLVPYSSEYFEPVRGGSFTA